MNNPIRKFFMTVIVVFVVLSNAIQTSAADESAGEYTVKIAFIYNFTKFITWPAEAFKSKSSPFVFGIMGDNPFNNDDQVLRNKMVNGRTLQVKPISTLDEARSCHILYVSTSEKRRFRHILKALGPFTLTVGDSSGFAEAGGNINFVIVDKKIRFEINSGSIEQSGLTVSSNLLKIALKIYP